jgi:hypothetical protein
MDRKQVCEQIIGATKSSLCHGEFVQCCGQVLATDGHGRVPLLFRSRSLHHVAVTNQRLILFRTPEGRRPLTADHIVLAKRHHALALEKTRHITPTLQLRIRASGDQKFVLEFPPRERKVGLQLEAALGEIVSVKELRRIKKGTYARKVRPLAEEIARMVSEIAPWTARPAFEDAVRSLAWTEAQVVLLRGWIDEHGVLDPDGQPQPAVRLLQRLESQASTLRAELGLTPQALARLLGSLATVATAGDDNAGLAALKAEGQRIVAARQAALSPDEGRSTEQNVQGALDRSASA